MRSRKRAIEFIRNVIRFICLLLVFLSIGCVGGIERGGSIGIGVVCGLVCIVLAVCGLIVTGDLR